MNLASALRYLDQHTNLETTAGRWEHLSLDRIRRLTEAMGDPQHAYPVVHVTGTNGKGSTVRVLSALLRASGLSVGAYTSPHLERINERLAWDGEPVNDDTLGALIGAVADLEGVSGVRPSYFEILTAAAFRWFADVAVDVAVIEVGLLGRFDATNVADGQVAVLTNIGADHTDGRGAWRQAIAEEKAGIVKAGATFVLGEVADDLRPIFDRTVSEVGAERLWVRGPEFDCDANRVAVGGRLVDLRTPESEIDQLYLPAHGAHQGDNAAIALAAAEAFFGRPLDSEVVSEAFAGLTLPGRFEVVRHEPTVVLDCAHNVDGAAAAARTLAEELTLSGSLILVMGLLQGRDPSAMLEAINATDAGFLVACTPASPRAIPAAEVAAAAERMGIPAEVVPSVDDAVQRALALATPDDLVLVAGSLYVVGAARSFLTTTGDGPYWER